MRIEKTMWLALLIGAVALAVSSMAVGAAFSSRKIKLERDDVYYDSVNDAGDNANFLFSYHVPLRDRHGNLTGKQVLCLVYKDHTKDGSMGGMSCDFSHVTPYTGG